MLILLRYDRVKYSISIMTILCIVWGVLVLQRHGLLVAVTLLILIGMIYAPANAAYRKGVSLGKPAKNYLMILSVNISSFGNYGFMSVYLKPDGVYGYGLTVLKDPDEDSLHAYLMAGTQKNWYDLGFVENRSFTFIIFLSLENNTLYYYWDNSTHKLNLSFTPTIEELYISVGNVTGRSSTYPSLVFEKLLVYSTNNTLREEISSLEDPEKIAEDLNMTLIVNLSETTPVNTVTSNPTTITTITVNRGVPDILFYVMATALIMMAVLLILIGLQKKRSPGP